MAQAEPISVYIVGLGVHGTSTAKLLPSFGVRVLGVADPSKTSLNVGEITGNSELNSLTVVETIDDLPWEKQVPDIMILTAAVEMDELQALSCKAFEYGANVLTIVGDSFDMESHFPDHFAAINAAAIQAGKSFVSTGGADVLWAGLVIHLTSQMRELAAVDLYTHIGVDGYPQDFLRWCGIGIKPEEFEGVTAEMSRTPSVFGGVLPTIIRKLGLTISTEKRSFTMFTAPEAMFSETYQRVIQTGEPWGTRDVVEIETEEGVSFRAELVTTGVNEKDEYVAKLHGVPEAELRHHLEPQHLSTESATLSRIVDVIAAQPGVISTADLPTPFFRRKLVRPAI